MSRITPDMPIQVAIPKRAFDALDLEKVRQRLVAIGSPRTQFEHNEHHAGVGMTRLTCRVIVAIAIVEELRICVHDAERRQDSRRMTACAEAVGLIFRAIEAESGRSRQ